LSPAEALARALGHIEVSCETRSSPDHARDAARIIEQLARFGFSIGREGQDTAHVPVAAGDRLSAAQIRRLRKSLGLTMHDLAKEAGVSNVSIFNIEQDGRGKAVLPRIYQAVENTLVRLGAVIDRS
jgi:DNA-binding XRE family transcriptional regulator